MEMKYLKKRKRTKRKWICLRSTIDPDTLPSLRQYKRKIKREMRRWRSRKGKKKSEKPNFKRNSESNKFKADSWKMSLS